MVKRYFRWFFTLFKRLFIVPKGLYLKDIQNLESCNITDLYYNTDLHNSKVWPYLKSFSDFRRNIQTGKYLRIDGSFIINPKEQLWLSDGSLIGVGKHYFTNLVLSSKVIYKKGTIFED